MMEEQTLMGPHNHISFPRGPKWWSLPKEGFPSILSEWLLHQLLCPVTQPCPRFQPSWISWLSKDVTTRILRSLGQIYMIALLTCWIASSFGLEPLLEAMPSFLGLLSCMFLKRRCLGDVILKMSVLMTGLIWDWYLLDMDGQRIIFLRNIFYKLILSLTL